MRVQSQINGHYFFEGDAFDYLFQIG